MQLLAVWGGFSLNQGTGFMAEGLELRQREKRDLVLAIGSYAYMQDVTKGNIKTYVGPTVINPTAQEVAVYYDPKLGTFARCETLEQAVRKSVVAVEGYYVQLLNPSKDQKQPAESSTSNGAADQLDVGRKVIIPGPANFALWPGQAAEVIRGHHLRSNQYLLARVYNEEQAKKNWSNAIVKRAVSTIAPLGENPTAEQKKTFDIAVEEEKKATLEAAKPPDLTVGKLFVIKGTEVSFYIPPTGIVIVPDEIDASTRKATYSRDALTLERLEYCILVGESGNKRYEYGPSVVFPQPTERFLEDRNAPEGQNRKFRAIELNDIQGLHLKVIADYKDKKTGIEHKAGEELFITGKETAIYYPQEEHSSVKYDGKTKHFATAIPAGEGRYVLNRMTGEIRMVKGPAMLLPDPRKEIIVRRVLSDKQVQFWYPGNAEALAYNQELRQIMRAAPSTRGNAVSEGDVDRNAAKGSRMRGINPIAEEHKTKGGLIASTYASSSNSLMESSNVSKEQGFVGEEFSRSSNYNQPRTMTLDTKYQGVPTIEIWTGYACMVVSKSGARKVVMGPATYQLEYDESLEVMELSTGKPKTTDNLLRTAYLRVENNKISDVVRIETLDHVQVELYMSFLVTFEGKEKEQWFSVENYIKFLCDHVRSVLKGQARKLTLERFYADSTDIVRDIIVGKPSPAVGEKSAVPRSGMLFKENNMRLLDVEVLRVNIADERIRVLLDNTQHDVVKSNIDLSTLHRNLDVTRTREDLAKQEASIRAESAKAKNEFEREVLGSMLVTTLARIGNSLAEMEEQKKLEEASTEMIGMKHAAKLGRDKAEHDHIEGLEKASQARKIEFMKAEAEALVQKFKAVEGNFTTALLQLSSDETLVKVSEAMSIQRVLGGDSIADTLAKAFPTGPLSSFVKALTAGGQGSVLEGKKPGNGAPAQG